LSLETLMQLQLFVLGSDEAFTKMYNALFLIRLNEITEVKQIDALTQGRRTISASLK
jgi:hypothetical protein